MVYSIPALALPEPLTGSAPTLSGTWGAFLASAEHRVLSSLVERFLARECGFAQPMLLYGPSGWGKSHMLRRLDDAWQLLYPGETRLVVSAAQWRRRAAGARRAGLSRGWHNLLDETRLLIVDDLDTLAPDLKAQEDLARALDRLATRGAAVALASRAAPRHLPLVPQLQSRIAGGTSWTWPRAGALVRAAVVRRFFLAHNVAIADDAVALLVERIDGSLRELLAASVLLESAAGAGKQIERASVEEYLSHRARPSVSLGRLVQKVARQFGLAPGDLRSPSRRRPVVVARGVAIYIARDVGRKSFQELGKFFGGRDHSTIMHAYRQVPRWIECDATVRRAVEQLRLTFTGRPD